MGLIDDNTAPLYGVEFGTASQDHLEGGDNSLEPVGSSQRTTLMTGRGEMWDTLCQIIF